MNQRVKVDFEAFQRLRVGVLEPHVLPKPHDGLVVCAAEEDAWDGQVSAHLLDHLDHHLAKTPSSLGLVGRHEGHLHVTSPCGRETTSKR